MPSRLDSAELDLDWGGREASNGYNDRAWSLDSGESTRGEVRRSHSLKLLLFRTCAAFEKKELEKKLPGKHA